MSLKYLTLNTIIIKESLKLISKYTIFIVIYNE